MPLPRIFSGSTNVTQSRIHYMHDLNEMVTEWQPQQFINSVAKFLQQNGAHIQRFENRYLIRTVWLEPDNSLTVEFNTLDNSNA